MCFWFRLSPSFNVPRRYTYIICLVTSIDIDIIKLHISLSTWDTIFYLLGRCVDPCIGRCGRGAVCSVVDHSPFCSCPARTTGDARSECKTLQCIENNDCDSGKSCVKNQCVDVCRLDGVCGGNAQCTTINHTPLCSCAPGHTGDPTVGCTRIQQCAVQNDCPNNMICAFGVCSRK